MYGFIGFIILFGFCQRNKKSIFGFRIWIRILILPKKCTLNLNLVLQLETMVWVLKGSPEPAPCSFFLRIPLSFHITILHPVPNFGKSHFPRGSQIPNPASFLLKYRILRLPFQTLYGKLECEIYYTLSSVSCRCTKRSWSCSLS